MAVKFTQKAQNVLNRSLSYAREMGHTYIGSEHILMGLAGEENSVAHEILTSHGAELEKIRDAVVSVAGLGSISNVDAGDMTPRTKRIIEMSSYEAIQLGQSYIGTEHLLKALLSEHDCVAVKILEDMRVSISDMNNDLLGYLGRSGGTGSTGGRPGSKTNTGSSSNTPTLANH